MNAKRTTRRQFLQRGIASGAAAGAAASLVARQAHGRVEGAGDRLSIGIIGCGGRAGALMGQIQAAAAEQNCQITAVCDVWKPNLEQAAAKVKGWFGREPRKFTRFNDVLALGDVDAVVVATPDFGHCPIMIAALEAGKDVYCEKPMALEVENANRALDLARANDRVVQVGTQRRSEGRWPAAGAAIAAGTLGKLSRVSVGNFFNQARWARSYDNCKQPDVDWDAYLFNRPKVAFDPRLLRRWHLFKMCTNGISGLWMVHHIDSIHMLTGSTYPNSAVAHGGTYIWKEDREHCDTFHALLDYPEEFLVSWAMGLGNESGTHFTVHGTEGTLDVNTWTVSPDGPKAGKTPDVKIEGKPNQDHMVNWLECIRSRRRPNADIEYGHQHAVASIMAAKAQETGLRHTYDRKSRTISAG